MIPTTPYRLLPVSAAGAGSGVAFLPLSNCRRRFVTNRVAGFFAQESE